MGESLLKIVYTRLMIIKNFQDYRMIIKIIIRLSKSCTVIILVVYPSVVLLWIRLFR